MCFLIVFDNSTNYTYIFYKTYIIDENCKQYLCRSSKAGYSFKIDDINSYILGNNHGGYFRLILTNNPNYKSYFPFNSNNRIKLQNRLKCDIMNSCKEPDDGNEI